MQRETSNDSFLDYGSVYHQPIDREHPELIHQTMVAITRRYVSQFYCFNCDTYLQVKSGIGVLLVSHTAEAADVQEFAMNRLIHIRPNIYFAVVSTTQKLEYDLYAESSYLLHITDFPSQYEFLAVLPRIEIQKILGYYYRIRTENYCFKGELHDFFELTYVDTGELETEVDGTLYHLKEKDLMIYGPGQFHTQYTDEEHRASYMTILFDMRNLTPVEREVWYDALINRVFHYDQKINTLLKTFVRESTTGIPYMNSLMLCLLTETIIRLLQGTYASPMAPASSTAHQSAMDELFDRIIAYIDDNIYDPLTIPEILRALLAVPVRSAAAVQELGGPVAQKVYQRQEAGAQLSDAPREPLYHQRNFAASGLQLHPLFLQVLQHEVSHVPQRIRQAELSEQRLIPIIYKEGRSYEYRHPRHWLHRPHDGGRVCKGPCVPL